tara:strand:+ start:20 stop:478 length:459 start_codon:yes stop_codon:yes gene_type:complete
MKSFKKYITEAFDKPYKWKVYRDGEYWHYQFKTDDGRDGLVSIEDGWEMESLIVNFDMDGHIGITGRGDSFRIFATVLAIIGDIIKIYSPKMISFSASKERWDREEGEYVSSPSRSKLYKKLVQRFASKAGYKSKIDANSFRSSTLFSLEKK